MQSVMVVTMNGMVGRVVSAAKNRLRLCAMFTETSSTETLPQKTIAVIAQ
jgi:hypothetical protein